jgi:hypothetical protein
VTRHDDEVLRHSAFVAILVAALATTGACDSGGSGGGHAAGFLTPADLGGRWHAVGDDTNPALDVACESAAFLRFPPTTKQSRRWTHAGGEPHALTEYLLGYDSESAAKDALSTYGDFVPQCQATHPKESAVTLPSLDAVATSRPAGAHGSRWLVFAVGGDHAAWLVVDGGSKDDIVSLTESAVRRLG